MHAVVNALGSIVDMYAVPSLEKIKKIIIKNLGPVSELEGLTLAY